MPKRGRGHGDDEEISSRPHDAAGGSFGSIRQAQDSIEEAAKLGRRSPDLITQSAGLPPGTPDGRPTRIHPGSDDLTRRSIEMENSAAAFLAGHGWRLKQNPTPDEGAQARRDAGDIGSPTTNPDFLLEGRVFDCYSPTLPTKSPRGIWGEVEEKVVERRQTQRVVVNLEDWRGDLTALRKQFADWPIEGLKEVKVITADGKIEQIDLPDQAKGT